MHLKQQNNLLINYIWTTENFSQEASSGSLSFHPVFMVLGNKKSDYKEKCQSNFAFWFAVVHVHFGLKVTSCGLLYAFQSTWLQVVQVLSWFSSDFDGY